MIKLKRILFLIMIFLTANVVYCQPALTNRNATIFCAPGSVIWVNGAVHNIGDSLYNLGSITIAGDSAGLSNGDLINDGLVSGNGKYYIAGHWINNNTFKHGTSEVIMDNNPNGLPAAVLNQKITGTNITSFYDLTLTGIGIKSVTLNDTATHSLNLNDRELAIDSFHFWVTNPDPLAITRTSGYVSNLTDGWLYRIATINGPYLFPMGSSVSYMRYRPVAIEPSIADSNIYRVGFFNYNPTTDGYDYQLYDTATICMVDSLFYHRINRIAGIGNNPPVDLTIYYEEQTDGPWDGMANWNEPALGIWNNMAPTTQVFTPMEGIIKSNWNTWTEDPYALIAKVPDSVVIEGPDYACIGAGPFIYQAYGDPDDNYIWTVTGGHFVGDSTGANIQIEWDSACIGVVTMQEIVHWGYCVSMQSHFYTVVYPEPIAAFQIIPSDTAHIFSYDLIHFVDTSLYAAQWFWTFGDGMSSTLESPYHIYDKPGFYDICLSIISPDYCIDSACTTIEVEEGMVVPNVFTPNGDGFNDDYDIRCSGMTQFYLQIYNRWGVLMFESESPTVRWNGKTLSGGIADEGTYYFILNASSDTKDYSQHGFLTLLR
jgi:gliding motility-associated-like protein